MEKKFILIIGGVRSGKSSYAVETAKVISKRVVFIATAACSDKEMEKRIKRHKASRPKYWKVVEERANIDISLAKLKSNCDVVLIDCLGLLVSNLLAENLTDTLIKKKLKDIIGSIIKRQFSAIVVSNDVGSGVVPDNVLARRFRDLLGLANQMMAKKADEVFFMQAGIPLKIKG